MAQGGGSQPTGEAFLRSLQGQPPPHPQAPSVQEFSPLRPFPQAGSLPPHGASLFEPPLAWSAPQGINPAYLPLSDSQMQQAITKLVAPVFKPHEGMVHHLSYAAEWATLFHNNFYVLESNTALQFHLLLGSCTSPAAEQFLVSNVEAIIAQCKDPLAGQLLRSLTNKGNARSTGEHFMHLSQLLHGGHVATLAAPPQAQVLSINDSNLPRDLIDAAKAAYTVDGHSGKSLHLIWAWISVCEKNLCIPTKDEFKAWERGLIMGQPSIFEDVLPTETPVAFSKRVLSLHSQFKRHAPDTFALATRQGPLHVFMNGLPQHLRPTARRALMDAGVDHTTPEQLLLNVAERVRNHHAFTTFWEAEGSILGERYRNPSLHTPPLSEPNHGRLRPHFPSKSGSNVHAQRGSLLDNAEDQESQVAASAAAGVDLTYPPEVHPPRSSFRQERRQQPGGGRGRGSGGTARQPHPTPQVQAKREWRPCQLCGSIAHATSACESLPHCQQHVKKLQQDGVIAPPVSSTAKAPAPDPSPGKAPPSQGPTHRSSATPARPIAAAGALKTKIPMYTDSDTEEDDDHHAIRRVSFGVSSFCAIHIPDDVSCDHVESKTALISEGQFMHSGSGFTPPDDSSRTRGHSPPSTFTGSVHAPSTFAGFRAQCDDSGRGSFQPPVDGRGSFQPPVLDSTCFAGQSSFDTPPTLSVRLATAMHELAALRDESTSPSHRQDKLQVVREILGVLTEVCSGDMTAVSAGAVSESYTKSKKNLVPESFVPVKITGPRDNPTKEEPPSDVKRLKKGLPDPPRNFGTSDVPSLLQQPVASIIDPPAISDSSHTLSIGTNEVQKKKSRPLERRRPLSFEIDWSKMTPDSSYPVPGILNWPKITDPPVSMLADAKALHASPQDSQSDGDRIDRYLGSLQGTLSYFAPVAQVGVEYNGVKHSDSRIMLDLGSNLSLVDDKWCGEKGIPILPTHLSLSTSNATSTAVLGTTPVCTVSYGSPPNEVRTQHAFLVVPYRKKAPFKVLIGNGDAMALGGIQDLGTNSFSIRTQFSTMGTRSPVLSYPLISSLP